jgi:O-antigen ligase
MEIERTTISKLNFFLLCALLVFSTLAYGAVHQPIIALVYLIIAISVILWGIDSIRTGVLKFSPTVLQIPIILTVAYALIQILPLGAVAEVGGLDGIRRTISLEPFWTQMFALHLLALFFFFALMASNLDSSARLRRLTSLITVFGFLFAFFAILQYVLSPTKIYGIYEAQHAAQPFGSFVNRHNFAAFMEMSIAVPLGMIFVGAIPRDQRLIILTAIGLMGVALIMSGSRGGLVALIAALVFLVLITSKAKNGNQIAIRVVLVILLLLVVVIGSIFIGGESSLTRLAETARSDDFSTNRLQIWKVTLDVITQNLPFGAGIGAFAAAYSPHDPMNGLARVEQAHNDYLQILADAGLVGLAIAIFFVYKLFRIGLANAATENIFRRGVAVGALAGCFAILVHSIFDFVLHTTAITLMFLTLVGLIVASGFPYPDDERIYERKRRKSNVTPIEGKRKREELVS